MKKVLYNLRDILIVLEEDKDGEKTVFKVYTDHGHNTVHEMLNCKDCENEFCDEAEKLQKANHFHIIKCIDIASYEINNLIYPAIILPYYSNTFRILLKREIEEDQFKRLFKKILMTLKSLHKKEIIHGDIKPDNMMFNDDIFEFVFIDFGNSVTFKEGKDYYSRLTTSGFISPENIEGRELTEKIDIYALAVTMILIYKKEEMFSSFDDKIQNIKDEVVRKEYVRRLKIMELKERNGWKTKLNTIFPNQTVLRDLLYNMLQFKDYLRYNARDCLRHRYFKKRKRLITYEEHNKKNKTT